MTGRPAGRERVLARVPRVAERVVAVADVHGALARDDAVRPSARTREHEVVSAQVEGLHRRWVQREQRPKRARGRPQRLQEARVHAAPGETALRPALVVDGGEQVRLGERVAQREEHAFGAADVARRPRLDRLLGGIDVAWAPAPAPLALSPGVPLVLTVHDRSFEQRPRDFTRYERLWHRLTRPRALAARARAVVCDTDAVRADLASAWGVDATVVPPGPLLAPPPAPAPRPSAGNHAAPLRSVERHVEPAPQFVVVDSGSSDGGADVARAHGADTIILGGNPGFGAANNAGPQRAQHDGAVLLNPDCEAIDGSLTALAARAARGDALLV